MLASGLVACMQACVAILTKINERECIDIPRKRPLPIPYPPRPPIRRRPFRPLHNRYDLALLKPQISRLVRIKRKQRYRLILLQLRSVPRFEHRLRCCGSSGFGTDRGGVCWVIAVAVIIEGGASVSSGEGVEGFIRVCS